MQTPACIRIKRAIFESLKDYAKSLKEPFGFDLKQDAVSFLQNYDWNKNQRLVVVYLDRVEKSEDSSCYVDEEIATFKLLCAVCPDENDDSVAFEGLYFLAKQISEYLESPQTGISVFFPQEIHLNHYSKFQFETQFENRLSTERLVVHGSITFSVHYQINKGCEEGIRAFGIDITRKEEENAEH